jgi:hypothetical protein
MVYKFKIMKYFLKLLFLFVFILLFAANPRFISPKPAIRLLVRSFARFWAEPAGFPLQSGGRRDVNIASTF